MLLIAQSKKLTGNCELLQNLLDCNASLFFKTSILKLIVITDCQCDNVKISIKIERGDWHSLRGLILSLKFTKIKHWSVLIYLNIILIFRIFLNVCGTWVTSRYLFVNEQTLSFISFCMISSLLVCLHVCHVVIGTVDGTVMI